MASSPGLRQLLPSIDRALEAVCLKAMEQRPEDRYSSTKALADDIDRWMADEPVTAWREPLARRARRWARRNRTAVATAAMALAAGVLGLAAVLVVQTKARADIARSLASETCANIALAAANDELSSSKAAVQARYDLAVDAIKTFHTGVSEDFLLKQDKFKELRDRLLRSAFDFYGKLGCALGRETDFAARRALAQSSFDVAELTAKVGREGDALAAHHAVLAARESLAVDPEADLGAKVDVGHSLIAAARLLEATAKTDLALTSYRQAETLLADLAAADHSARAALAVCRSQIGSLLTKTGQRGDALAAYKLARADQETLAASSTVSAASLRDLAVTIHRIGLLYNDIGKPSEAEAEYRAALAIRKKLADLNPGVTEFRGNLADSHVEARQYLVGHRQTGGGGK